MLVPGDLPKQRTDTTMDHTGRQDSRMDAQLTEHAMQDASGSRTIVQGHCATLSGFTGRIDEEKKRHMSPIRGTMKWSDEMMCNMWLKCPTHLCTTYGLLVWSTVFHRQRTTRLHSTLAAAKLAQLLHWQPSPTTILAPDRSIWTAASAQTLLMNSAPSLTPTKSQLDDPTEVQMTRATFYPTPLAPQRIRR